VGQKSQISYLKQRGFPTHMSEYNNPFADIDPSEEEIGVTFDRVAQERGLGDEDSLEALTGEDLEAFIAAEPKFIGEFIDICTQARQDEDIVDPKTGRYNDPCLQKFDRVLAKLGYAYDKGSQSYVQQDSADIVIQQLSRQGVETARALPTEEPTY